MDPSSHLHMRLDQGHQRRQRGAARADPVGQGRDIKVDAFAGEDLALPVQRQVLAELHLQDHRQQVRTSTPACNRMERRRGLADGLAGTAGEFPPHRLNNLPLPGDHFQRLGDCLPQFGQLAAAAWTGTWAVNEHTLARQMLGQRRADRLAAGKRLDRRCLCCRGRGDLARRCLQFLELQFHLVKQLAAAFRRGAEAVVLELGDQQSQVRHHRLGAGGPRLGFTPRQLFGRERRAERSDVLRNRLGGGCHAED